MNYFLLYLAVGAYLATRNLVLHFQASQGVQLYSYPFWRRELLINTGVIALWATGLPIWVFALYSVARENRAASKGETTDAA